jgi:multidrug efflux pump
MNISELSIKRPVLATVVVLIITIFGVLGYTFLGTREFPSVDQPIITVNVSYPGANADVIMNQITEPLEQNINGIPGIRSLSSVSSQGSSRITVEFELSVDMETAANDVRDKVSRAQRFLPRDCDPPTVSKADADATPIMQISVRSDTRSLMEVSEIADLTVKERLQTIQDVSGVSIWGEKRYSMRLWLDPDKMAGYGVTPMDVKNAIDKENVELPSGRIEGDKIELSIRTLGLMSTPYEFNNVIIKRNGSQIVRFQDIGRAELGPEDTRSAFRKDGVPMVVVVIVPQPGANHIMIADEAIQRVEQLKKDLPEDVSVDVLYDNTQYIRASIKEVRDTIFIAFLLVVFIIFVFLRDWRVTLVPVVVIPVSLIGAFFVMYLAGFSINVLSMLAVVLSVGLVVDDAIVVTENIYIRIERGMSPREAGIEGSKEIFFAVISTTITLIAVFLPIVFMEGMTGRLFKEFSIVIAGSVGISSIVALTFTPMLATKILKRREHKNWIYTRTEPFFERMIGGYARGLGRFLKTKWLTIPIMLVLFGSIAYFWVKIPSELSPMEDRSQFTVRVTGQEGSTFEYIRDVTDRIADITDSITYEKRAITARSSTGSGFVTALLPNISERERSQMEIAELVTRRMARETQARVFVQQTSTFGGSRGGMPVQYVLQAPTLAKLQEVLPAFMEEVDNSPILRMADVNLKFTKPETRIVIDRDKATSMGVSTLNIAQTLQYALSGQRMGYFYMNGKQYQILGEINRQQRNTPLDLKSLFIRSSGGDMIQLDNLVTLNEDVAPPQLYRYNRFVSATVSSGLNEGYTIGDGLDEMDRIAKKVLDDSFRTALAGESKEFRESSSSLMFAMMLALVLIFLVLAAQFESFKDPVIVMITVPLALAGGLALMSWTGQTMNIFSQIGLIMLIGLVAKNGILIVEFANQKQNAGIPKMEAVAAAAVQRLRPVLMTSISTVLGLIPLVFASGEGANGRITMGVAVVGGLVFATFMTLFVVPAVYGYIATDRSKKIIHGEVL